MISMPVMILSFLLAITILVAVHEFGHFWVARRMGVKVLRFSIGFGKPLLRWRRKGDDTEYVIAAIPLGGYVKMLDEREGEVAEADLHQAFNRKPLGARMAVVIAGPLFNFLFAIVAFWLMFMVGVSDVRPVIGKVTPESPAAAAGLKQGEEIVAVNGKPTPVWQVVMDGLAPAMLERQLVELTVRGDGRERVVQVDMTLATTDEDSEDFFATFGAWPAYRTMPPKVMQVLSGSPAEEAGMQVGDQILEIDGRAIPSAQALVDYVSPRAGQRLQFLVRRGEEGEMVQLAITPQAAEVDGRTVGRIGVAPLDREIPDELRTDYHFGIGEAFLRANAEVWNKTAFILHVFYKMVAGDISLNKLSGPITIARYAGISVRGGFSRFMQFLALVSISLGVINLFPIPVLDGGHLLFYIVEGIRGKPVSERTEFIGQQVGIVLILMLMVVAFYNDILRLLN